jgi:hypothetical protein
MTTAHSLKSLGYSAGLDPDYRLEIFRFSVLYMYEHSGSGYVSDLAADFVSRFGILVNCSHSIQMCIHQPIQSNMS